MPKTKLVHQVIEYEQFFKTIITQSLRGAQVQRKGLLAPSLQSIISQEDIHI